MIDLTLNNLRQTKDITKLFKKIIVKFQLEGQDHFAIILWLKSLIKIHWISIMKKADQEDLGSLGQIQAYIQNKTKQMNQLMMLKGKLELLNTTLVL